MLNKDDKEWMTNKLNEKPDTEWVQAEVASQNDKLRREMNTRFDIVEERANQRHSEILTFMKRTMAKLESFGKEQAFIGYQLKRHEQWIEQIAEKTATKLES